MITTLLKIIAH